ncbi:hypothetical protein F4780DRAFT_752028 [Xylariomycetidae sp. FL0641]|nr:hypothetical protein F4780DRAFT_752028 [Xylariomycetidae sp. FL0641]
MTRHAHRLSEDNSRVRSRPSSQPTHPAFHSPHSHPHSSYPHSHSHSRPRSPHRSKPHHKSLHHKPTSSSHIHNPSPLKMVTTTAPSHHSANEAQYYYLPDTDASEQELELQGYGGWMEPIVIDDDDLMFGGKSLSAWYEEERQALSYPVEEERRGRQRVRQQYTHSTHSHKSHHHHHQHHPHHPHHHSHHHGQTMTTDNDHEQQKH